MVYVIIEYFNYLESPDYNIVCVVDNEQKAEEIVSKLEESVNDYNSHQDLVEVDYYYKEFELNDISIVDRFIKKNKDGDVYNSPIMDDLIY